MDFAAVASMASTFRGWLCQRLMLQALCTPRPLLNPGILMPLPWLLGGGAAPARSVRCGGGHGDLTARLAAQPGRAAEQGAAAAAAAALGAAPLHLGRPLAERHLSNSGAQV